MMNPKIAKILTYKRGSWCWTHTRWNDNDLAILRLLCEAKAPIEASADTLGRTPSSIAHKARDSGLRLPKEWADAAKPKPAALTRGRKRQR